MTIRQALRRSDLVRVGDVRVYRRLFTYWNHLSFELVTVRWELDTPSNCAQFVSFGDLLAFLQAGGVALDGWEPDMRSPEQRLLAAIFGE